MLGVARVEVVSEDKAGALGAIIDHVGERVADVISVSSIEPTTEGFTVTVLGPIMDLQRLAEPFLQ